MAGPNSAPNGDASLVSSAKHWCKKHSISLFNCDSECIQLTKRQWLASKNRLRTGKTK